MLVPLKKKKDKKIKKKQKQMLVLLVFYKIVACKNYRIQFDKPSWFIYLTAILLTLGISFSITFSYFYYVPSYNDDVYCPFIFHKKKRNICLHHVLI